MAWTSPALSGHQDGTYCGRNNLYIHILEVQSRKGVFDFFHLLVVLIPDFLGIGIRGGNDESDTSLVRFRGHRCGTRDNEFALGSCRCVLAVRGRNHAIDEANRARAAILQEADMNRPPKMLFNTTLCGPIGILHGDVQNGQPAFRLRGKAASWGDGTSVSFASSFPPRPATPLLPTPSSLAIFWHSESNYMEGLTCTSATDCRSLSF